MRRKRQVHGCLSCLQSGEGCLVSEELPSQQGPKEQSSRSVRQKRSKTTLLVPTQLGGLRRILPLTVALRLLLLSKNPRKQKRKSHRRKLQPYPPLHPLLRLHRHPKPRGSVDAGDSDFRVLLKNISKKKTMQVMLQMKNDATK